MLELWPFTNFHDLNLDWIIKTVLDLVKKMQNFVAEMTADWQQMKDDWQEFIDSTYKDQITEILEDHPEWVTTVMDGAITESKINSAFLKEIKNVYYTPQMFGATGADSVDVTSAFQDAIDAAYNDGGGLVVVPPGVYNVSTGHIDVKSNVPIVGIGMPKLYTRNTSNGYFSIFRTQETELSNVLIEGLFIDQWEELETYAQPDNVNKPYCAIALTAKCENITIKNNIINAVGGWAISVSDTTDNYGSNMVTIKNNIVRWKRAGDGTWYDSSAIYAESENHFIENNYVETIRPSAPGSTRWKLEGGIETHGTGVVRFNTVINAQAGVNVVNFKYNTAANSNTKREIYDNKLINVSRGVWLWIPTNPDALRNIDIVNNTIKVVAEGYYAGYYAIGATMSETPYTHPTYNGKVEGMNIEGNICTFTENGYTGNEYFQLINTAGISLYMKGIFKDINIRNNSIDNFPYPGLVIGQWDTDASRYHKDVNVESNIFTDCGYNMPNQYQSMVFYASSISGLNIHKNIVRWVNHNTTQYLLQFGPQSSNAKYVENIQETENSFTIYTVLSSPDIPSVYVDARNTGYRSLAGSPINNLTPKRIGEMVFNTTGNTWYISNGATSTDWYELN